MSDLITTASPDPDRDPPGKPVPPRRRKQRDPSVRLLLEQLRRDIPGQPTDNRLEQSSHYKGVIYVAIRTLRDAISGATVQVTRRRPQQSYAGTAVSRMVRKALPTPYAHASDERYEPVVDARHSLVKLFDSPNPTETITDLLGQLLIQYHLTGSGLLWGNPDQAGVPSELYVLPTALCWPQPVSPNYPDGAWRVTQYYPSGGIGLLPSPISGGGTLIDGRDVFQFKNPHPLWRWDGYSPLTAGAVQLDILESIDQARWTAMEMGLTPDAVLLLPGLGPDEVNTILEQVRQTNMGKRNHRKTLGVGGGTDDSKFDVKFPNIAAKDMDFSSGWEQMVGFALALFGVPKAVASLVSANSYAELYASLKQFHTLVLRPLCARLASFLTRRLARIWGEDLSVQIDLPTIQDPEQFEKQLEADLAHDGVTYNEYRALRNRPPVEGGDVLASVYVEVEKAKAQFDLQMKQQAQQQAMGLGGPPQPGAPGAPPPDGTTPAPDAQATPSALEALFGSASPAGDAGNSDAQEVAKLFGTGNAGDDAPAEDDQKRPPPPRVPEPRNPSGLGSLAPKIDKAMKYGSTHVRVPAALAEKLRTLAAKVADEDLADDGREEDFHVTCLYGLHGRDPAQVRRVVRGSGPVDYRLGKVKVFKNPEHDVVVAEVDSPGLHALRERLAALPHTSTFPEYKPHCTIAYVKPGKGDHYAKLLGGVHAHATADSLVFSDADRRPYVVPLATKAMSYLHDAAGGALVGSAAHPKRVMKVKRAKGKLRLRKMRRVCKALLEAGDE